VTNITSGSKGSRSISVRKCSNSCSQISDWKQCYQLSAGIQTGFAEAYLEEDSWDISALLEWFNPDAFEAFLVFVVLCYLAGILAVFGRTAIGVDVCEVRVSCTTVLAYPESRDLLDTHFDLLGISLALQGLSKQQCN
jgi:hypothetical protein